VSGWGWRPDRSFDDVRVGSIWTHAVAAVVPFVTVGVLLLMLHLVGGAMTTATGVLFDLPETDVGDGAVTESVALIVPMRHETLVFFDDSRYVIGSEASMQALGDRLEERFARSGEKTLLVLADRRVACGELMEFAARARRSGVERVLFAEKGSQETSD